MIPFFINSNIITNKSNIVSYESVMDTIAKNSGNSYITWSLLKELGITELKDANHIQSIYSYDFSKSDETAEYINSCCSHVFLILQDQIRISESYGYTLPFEKIITFLEKIQKPIVVAGLGANSFNGFDTEFYKELSPELVKFLHYISGRCVELGVRGNFTAEVLNQLGIKNVNPIGCPSFFETGANRIIKKNPVLDESKVLFTSFYPNPLQKNSYQVCQDELEKTIIEALLGYPQKDFYNNDDLFFERNIKYMQKKYFFSTNIKDWKNFVRKFDFAIGYRVHGCILSLNSGVPAVCCNGDSRATEMCELLKIPHKSAMDPTTDLKTVYTELDLSQMNNAYNSLYQNFKFFIKQNCGVEISQNNESIKQPVLDIYRNYRENFISSTIEIITNHESRITNHESRITNHESRITNHESRITNHESRITNHESRITKMESIIQSQRIRIEELESFVSMVKGSLAYRLLRKVYRIHKKIFKEKK